MESTILNDFMFGFIYLSAYIGLFIIFFYLITFFENTCNIKTKKTNKDYFVSFIIPAYNKKYDIGKCIRAILNSDYPHEKMEILVIDDGSTDDTYKIAKRYESAVVRVYTKKNSGKAATMNYGIHKARGEIVCCVDADTFLSRNLIKKAVSYFSNKDVGVVVPTLKPYKPRSLIEKIQLVEYTLSSFSRKLLSFHDSLAAAPACSFFRREIFEKYGGFDEGNLTEDFEMALKAQSKNYKLIHLVDSVAYTDVPNNIKDLARQRVRWCYGASYNFRKYKHLFNTKYGDFGILFFPLIITSVMLSLMLFGLIIYNLFDRIYNLFKVWSLVGYNLTFNLDLINILQYFFSFNFVLGFFIISLGIIILLFSRYYTRESKDMDIKNGSNFSIFDYIIYAFFYSIFLISFWGVSLFYFVFNKKPKW
jgi:cellulose synthase/poly-beta-1,6-N-acetylglucosamine synthase-like glycosyltransferase